MSTLLIAGAMILSVSVASPVRADTIQITDGNAVLTSFLLGDATFDLTGAGFHISGQAVDTGGALGCWPCTGGTDPVSYGWGGDSWGHGPVTIGSTTYANAWFGGDIHMTGSATIPAVATAPFSVVFPFTVVPGSFLTARAAPGTPNFFSANLTGAGLATMTLSPDIGSSTVFTPHGLRFDFTSAETSPTPEPMTGLLVGAGLLAAYRARKRAA